MTRTTVRRRHRPLALGLMLSLIAAVGFAPGGAAAADPPVTSDLFAFDSVDDYIGQGQRLLVTDADASITIAHDQSTPNDLLMRVLTSDGQTWVVRLQAPIGQLLAVGAYPDAGGGEEGAPDISIRTYDRGCGSSSLGSFEIHALTTGDDGIATSIAASFEQFCDGGPGPLVGRIRVDSDLPIAALSTPSTSSNFASVTVGESSDVRTYTVEAIGDLPVTMGPVSIHGTDAADVHVIDGCDGDVLQPGQTCTFQMWFRPLDTGERYAGVAIASSAPLSPRAMLIRGYGRIPTTTAVRVESDWVYFRPGIALIGTVTPNPAHNAIECWLDEELLATGTVNADGHVLCVAPRELGTHTFRARYQGSPFYGDSWSPLVTFDVSTTTSVTLESTTPYPSTNKPVSLSARVSTASDLLYPGGTVTVRDTTTGLTLGVHDVTAEAPALTVSVPLAAGSHAIEATYTGVDGILDGSDADLDVTVNVDHSRPIASAPSNAFVAGSAISAGRIPVRLAWTGSDTGSGIEGFDVQRQTDGGAWSTSSTRVTGSTLTPGLVPGHVYRFRVRAVDRAGNLGSWMTGAAFRLSGLQETSGAIRYTGSWSLVASDRYWGGRARATSTVGARTTLTFTGRSVAWVTLKSASRGRADVFVNGTFMATVDLHSTSIVSQTLAWSRTWTTSATRTVEIRVRATVGRHRVDIDGFVTGS